MNSLHIGLRGKPQEKPMSLLQSGPFDRDSIVIDTPEESATARIVSGGYRLSCDRDQGLVRIAIVGFWDAATIHDFARDLLAEVRKVDNGSNRHVILCDLTRAVIQSQETFEGFSKLLHHGPTRARKLALVTGNLAMRMQAKRLINVRDTISIFASEGCAMSWLTEDTTQ
jgi:hypothetical protein